MKRPARSPSALLTLPPQNDNPEPTNRPSTRGNLINEPTLYFSPYTRKAMTSRPIKKTPATRSPRYTEAQAAARGAMAQYYRGGLRGGKAIVTFQKRRG